jgi:hypothetical protein
MSRRGRAWFGASKIGLRKPKRDDAHDDLGTPWTPAFEASRSSSPTHRGKGDRDAELVAALGRVADTFARIADGLDADRRERRVQFEADREDRRTQLDAVEYLLREMAIGVGGATAEPPIVVGGSIEPDALGASREMDTPELAIDLTETSIDEGSRTHG